MPIGCGLSPKSMINSSGVPVTRQKLAYVAQTLESSNLTDDSAAPASGTCDSDMINRKVKVVGMDSTRMIRKCKVKKPSTDPLSWIFPTDRLFVRINFP